MHQEKPENIHVLVVDDEEDIREVIQRAIQSAGYDCSTAGNVQEALLFFEEKHVDVVMTDIAMPGASGIELLEKVKERHDADVMVMTGFPEGLKYEEIIERGACDFIQKPVATKELLFRLKRVVRERAIISERNQAEKELKKSIDKLRRILEETVNALGAALEKRDPYTAGHQQRVARLACTIAEELGLSEAQIEGIRMAGLLHDIGKISSPTDILNKPSRLSRNEFNLIMEHPQTGYDILKDIEFEQPVALIVRQHHEMINASGYPQSLDAENILLEAKILAVADVVEAISSNRPYRQSLGKKKALDEITQKKGVLFDPVVVDTCLRLFDEKGYTFE